MDLIRQFIEFLATGLGGLLATLAPFGFIGLVGLYLLWLVIGYLRVSQVGIQAEAATLPAIPLPRTPEGVIEAPAGMCSSRPGILGLVTTTSRSDTRKRPESPQTFSSPSPSSKPVR